MAIGKTLKALKPLPSFIVIGLNFFQVHLWTRLIKGKMQPYPAYPVKAVDKIIKIISKSYVLFTFLGLNYAEIKTR